MLCSFYSAHGCPRGSAPALSVKSFTNARANRARGRRPRARASMYPAEEGVAWREPEEEVEEAVGGGLGDSEIEREDVQERKMEKVRNTRKLATLLCVTQCTSSCPGLAGAQCTHNTHAKRSKEHDVLYDGRRVGHEDGH